MSKNIVIIQILFILTFTQLYSQQNGIEEALQKITDVYSAGIDSAEKIEAWKNVISILKENNNEDKIKAADFMHKMILEILNLRITSKNVDVPVLVNFLKSFSKEEAVYILHLWIQANTVPDKVNGIYAPPEVFIKRRTGDCTEVAWLTETIFKELEIETTVFIADYRFDYSFKNWVRAHAFTGLEFIHNNGKRRYIIDNRNLYKLPPDIPWKNIIWQTYSQQSEVWQFKKIDTSLWRNVKSDTEDPQTTTRKGYISYAFMSKDTALKEFEGYNLNLYFDDLAQETVFIKEDFLKIIEAQKQTGEITETEYKRFFDIWYIYVNDGFPHKRTIN